MGRYSLQDDAENVVALALACLLLWLVIWPGEPEPPTRGTVIGKLYHEERTTTRKVLTGNRFEPVVTYSPRRYELLIVGQGVEGRCQVSKAPWERVEVGEEVDCTKMGQNR